MGDRDTMKSFFEPVVTGVIDLIRSVVTTETKVSAANLTRAHY